MADDIYERITRMIVDQLEQGVMPWRKSWSGDAPSLELPLRHNGLPYNGINVLVLWVAGQAAGYRNRIWMTFQQAKQLGGNVRKGEKSTPVVFFKTLPAGDDEPSDDTEDGRRVKRVARGYAVFNVAQIENLPDHYYATNEAEPQIAEAARIAELDAWFAALGGRVIDASMAAYRASDDTILMPPFVFFNTPADYYATLAHEYIHWTKGPNRLERDFGRKRWGDEGYAMEELVAELGAAFLRAALPIPADPIQESASYIDNWLKVLKGDKRAVFTASSFAGKAVDYLHQLAGREPAALREAA